MVSEILEIIEAIKSLRARLNKPGIDLVEELWTIQGMLENL